MKCRVLDIGVSDYSDCYSLQKKILNEIKNNQVTDHIIITEHNPVITIGRSGSRSNLLVSEQFLASKGIEVVETDRGGDVTYHGPGQIVMYPIIDLKNRDCPIFAVDKPDAKTGTVPIFNKPDLHKYLRYLEDTIIALLQEYNINSFRIKGKTGVWTKDGKIASIGIGASRWVTFHGVALNVDCDLTPFGWFYPCGFKDINVTSITNLIGKIDKEQVKQRLVGIFCKKMGTVPIFSELDKHEINK